PLWFEHAAAVPLAGGAVPGIHHSHRGAEPAAQQHAGVADHLWRYHLLSDSGELRHRTVLVAGYDLLSVPSHRGTAVPYIRGNGRDRGYLRHILRRAAVFAHPDASAHGAGGRNPILWFCNEPGKPKE